MNSRERVVAALEGKQPDRVPLVEWVFDEGVMDALLPGRDYYAFIEWLGLDNAGLNRSSWRRDNVDYVDREKGLFRDNWGVIRAFGPESTPYPVEGPIKVPEDLKTYQPPDPEADGVLGHLPDVVARYKGNKAICAIGRDAFFNPSHLRGMENFLLDMIIETGIDAINPLEPVAGMDIGHIKQKYGDRVAIIGNIDCGRLLCQASTAEVRAVARETIKVAAPGGGYCLSSSNSIHSSVNPENYYAMVETLRECGEYPLTI